MIVLFCGSREFSNEKLIAKVMGILPSDTEIIHGGARGADRIAAKLAKERKMVVVEYPANWNVYGKSAGYIRNKEMLEKGKPNKVYAFFKKGAGNKGTQMMVKLAEGAKIPTFTFWSE